MSDLSRFPTAENIYPQCKKLSQIYLSTVQKITLKPKENTYQASVSLQELAYSQIHTYKYSYIYLYVFTYTYIKYTLQNMSYNVCVCVCVCVCV